MQRRAVRNRATISHELAEATTHRADAARHLDIDAYQHLCEQIDDLLTELHALRGPLP